MKTIKALLILICCVATAAGGGHGSSGGGARSSGRSVASTARPVARANNAARIAKTGRIQPRQQKTVVVAPRPGGFWFPGYWGLGVWYPAFVIYPGAWYSAGWYDYSFNVGEFEKSGLKFDLDAIPKADRVNVENGIVYFDGLEIGSVRKITGAFHHSFPVKPGAHEIVIHLADGRELDTRAGIEPGHVTHLLLRFD